MKRILVPVDFSHDSLNAVKYGIAMANVLKAHVRIIHIKTGAHYSPAFARDEIAQRINGQVESWMISLIEQTQEEYKVIRGEIDWRVREGNVVREIANQAKYDDTSLIVVGSHGISGFEDKWIGSNAYRLVANAPCPILVVRHGMEYGKGLRKIILPIDFNRASRQKVPVVAGLAKVYNAKVYLVGLKESNFSFIIKMVGAFIGQVERYLKHKTGLEVEKTILSGKYMARDLNKYAEKVDADLITIRIHHSTNPLINMFRPFTNDMINTAPRPVLAIPTKD
ncbi:universal stress protein [Marinilabiliaceae bacterium JC017]|nr:universal stress protein [Marinilabiliaceae bacterium JC017]